jgi:hypothetical protein
VEWQAQRTEKQIAILLIGKENHFAPGDYAKVSKTRIVKASLESKAANSKAAIFALFQAH